MIEKKGLDLDLCVDIEWPGGLPSQGDVSRLAEHLSFGRKRTNACS